MNHARTAFIQVPHSNPSGGVKVSNQLANLFLAQGWRAYLVVASGAKKAHWLNHPAPVLSVQAMARMCQREDLIIDNWPAQRTMRYTLKLPVQTKVFYCQGCSFPKRRGLLLGDYFLHRNLGYTHFWAVSTDTLAYLQKTYPNVSQERWGLVHPYFAQDVFLQSRSLTRQRQILCLGRKGKKYIQYARKIFEKQIPFLVQEDFFSEQRFNALAHRSLFFLSTAIGIDNHYLLRFIGKISAALKHTQYHPTYFIIPQGHREGFPLPPAEAALAGAIVIGFAMGGGREWMNSETCFLARDRSLVSLLWQVRKALRADKNELETKRAAARHALARFTPEHTWEQIKKSLDL